MRLWQHVMILFNYLFHHGLGYSRSSKHDLKLPPSWKKSFQLHVAVLPIIETKPKYLFLGHQGHGQDQGQEAGQGLQIEEGEE